MKRLTALIALLAASPALASGSGPAPRAGLFVGPVLSSARIPASLSPSTPEAARGPVAILSQDNARKFREEFDEALKLNNKSLMDSLLGKYEAEAINAIVSTAEAIAGAPNEVLLTRFEGYREAWKRKKGTDFPDKIERLFANMPTSVKRQRLALRSKYLAATRKLVQLQQDKNAEGLKLAAEEMIAYAEGFKDMGDSWYESQAFFWAGTSINENNLGKKDVDFNKVADAYERFIKAREAIGVKDRSYLEVLPALKALHAQGYGEGAKAAAEGKAGAKPAAGPKANGAVVTTKMSFETLKPLADVNRPNYYLDEHRQIWPAVQLQKVGSTTKIPRLPDGPTIIRETPAKIMIDLDADGKGDLEWPTRGKYETLQFDLGSGDAKRPWALLTEVGRQQDFYQTQTMNLRANDLSYSVYYTPGGAMVGEIDGVKIQVIDDNLDGVYGSQPKAWGHQGLVPGNFQLEFDSIRVGKDKKARPFSRLVDLGGKAGWYSLKVKDGGNTIEAQPTTLETGTVQLKGKGLKPDFFILKGTDDALSNTFIDVSGGKKVDLPVGNYELAFGMVRKGKKMQVVKAVILPGPDSPRYRVQAGENLEIVAGAPYKFDFTYEVGAHEATISGESVHIVGAGGEVYDRFYGCVPYVEAELRHKGSKKGHGTVKLKPVVDNFGLKKHGWKGMWKPIDDKLAKKDEEVEVQIREKKNKLFGKVASDWK